MIFYHPRDGDLPRDGECPWDGDHYGYDGQLLCYVLGTVCRIFTILGRVTFIGMVTILRMVTIIGMMTILEMAAIIGIFTILRYGYLILGL